MPQGLDAWHEACADNQRVPDHTPAACAQTRADYTLALPA